MTVVFIARFEYPPKWCSCSAVWFLHGWCHQNCCHLCAFCVCHAVLGSKIVGRWPSQTQCRKCVCVGGGSGGGGQGEGGRWWGGGDRRGEQERDYILYILTKQWQGEPQTGWTISCHGWNNDINHTSMNQKVFIVYEITTWATRVWIRRYL